MFLQFATSSCTIPWTSICRTGSHIWCSRLHFTFISLFKCYSTSKPCTADAKNMHRSSSHRRRKTKEAMRGLSSVPATLNAEPFLNMCNLLCLSNFSYNQPLGHSKHIRGQKMRDWRLSAEIQHACGSELHQHMQILCKVTSHAKPGSCLIKEQVFRTCASTK